MNKRYTKPSANYEFFLKANTAPYRGEWIAISGKKIISHGKDAEEVYKKAKQKNPKANISLAKVPEEQTLILRVTGRLSSNISRNLLE